MGSFNFQRRSVRAVLMGMSALAGSTALMAPPAAAEDAVMLNSLTISAPAVETTTVSELAKYGSKTEIVTREQIERAGPSADVSRVLQMYVPGLYVAPKNGPFDYGSYSLLGGRADDILILLDGVRLNNRLYGGIYIDTLPTAAIERIEVLKGGQSLFFGTQAVSGVINIVTRRAQSKEYSGQASAGIDTFAGFGGDARVEKVYANPIGDFEALLYSSRNVSDGYQPFRDKDMSATTTDDKRSYDLTTVGTKLAQNFGEEARWEVFYQYTAAELDWARAANNRETHNDRTHQIATTTWEHKPADWLRYFVKGHLNAWDTDYTQIYNYSDGSTSTLNDGAYWGFRDWGTQAQANATLPGDHEIVLGVDSQWYRAKDEVYRIDRNKAEAFGFYGQFRPAIGFAPDWHPAVGLRHEAMTGGGDATVWNLSSLYDLTDNLALRGQVGTAFKLPTAEQLFVNEPGDEIGNPNLKPEKSLNYEAGLDYDTALRGMPLKLSGTVFHRRIEDLIALNGENWVNADGTITTRGFATDATLQLDANWTVAADYTRTITESASNARFNGIPSSMLRGRVNYATDNRDWGGEFASRYIGGIASSYNVDYGEYVVFDASVYHYLDDARRHKVTLMAENLFDREYATSLTRSEGNVIPNLGRPLTAELRYTFTF